MKVYFDNAATTPIYKEVIELMTLVMEEDFGNPSSAHAHGRKARTLIEDARKKVAHYFNCSPGEIFFTSGGTEADNMAIRKAVEDLGIKNIILSRIEHHAVLHTAEELAKAGKIKLHFVQLLSDAHIDLNHLETLLKQNPNSMVCLMHANNEIGNILDIEKVGNLCAENNALFQCDTVQTIGHFPVDLQKLKINFLACGAHKFQGPKGVGFIYINHQTKIHPLFTGGGQERNMRGGTENIYGIIGLAKALELAHLNMETNRIHIEGLKKYMIEQLKKNIFNISFNGDAEGNSLFTILNVKFPPTSIAEMILFKLDIEGISASGGSACSSGSTIGSHVLAALNVPDDQPSVRFSFGFQNTREEVDFVVNKLVEMFNAKN